MGAEEEVREAWDEVEMEEDFGFHIWLDRDRHYFFYEQNPEAAWTAAAEFTRLHRQKIAEAQEEIELQQFLYSHVKPKQQSTMDRTIIRLQEALADLRRGWKGKP